MRDQQNHDRLPDEPYYQQPESAPPSAPRRGRVRFGALLLLVGVLWLAFGVFGTGITIGGVSGSTTLLDRTASGARRIELEASNADVDVRTWNSPGIRVEAVQRNGRAGDYTVDYSESGDTVHVTTQSKGGICLFFCNRSMRYTVSMPADGQVTIRSASGDIELVGVSGASVDQAPSISTGSGDLKARELRNGLSVETSSGDVSLDDVAGALSISTSSGDVELRNGAVTSARVETTSGNINLRGVTGKLELGSSSGDIEVRDARDGLLALSASSGSIVYEGALARGSHTVGTVSGDVTLLLPRDSSFTLQATTISGDLSLDSFENQNVTSGRRELGASVGRGESQIQIETTSGDVEVRGR